MIRPRRLVPRSAQIAIAAFSALVARGSLSTGVLRRISAVVLHVDAQLREYQTTEPGDGSNNISRSHKHSLAHPGTFTWLFRLLKLHSRPGRLARLRTGLAELSIQISEPDNRPLPPEYRTRIAPWSIAGSFEPPVTGVNVFGDWGATTGLAQAARRLTTALEEAGLDLSLATVRSGAPVDETRVPDSLRQIADDRRYAIDLWMMNVNELAAVPDDLLRPRGRDSYAIGVWYWELTTFPDMLVAQMSRVDEIWVATSFVQSSFRAYTDKPVHVVPAIVPRLRGSGRTRKDFGLADDEVVFLFSFDVHSMVARKNPGAVIEAFSLAFPSAEASGTRLVVKVLNLQKHPGVARWLRDAVASVGGLLIEEDLKEEHLVDLFMCADSYVSLHRSEGFGFGIAESMALGKPVIATAYSGNTDFATAANSCQVGYRLRQIAEADHIYDEGASAVYTKGAVWAEPDISQAARWMKVIAKDPQLRVRLGQAARSTISEHYSAARVVDIVRARLSAAAARASIRA